MNSVEFLRLLQYVCSAAEIHNALLLGKFFFCPPVLAESQSFSEATVKKNICQKLSHLNNFAYPFILNLSFDMGGGHRNRNRKKNNRKVSILDFCVLFETHAVAAQRKLYRERD